MFARQLHRKTRAAFTLLELVLAAGLTSVVLAIIMTAMTIFVNIERSSQQELVSAELARNLLRQLEWDLRCIQAVKPADLISEDDSSAQGLAMALDPDAVVESLSEATAMEDFPVFVADAQSLQLIIEPRIDQFSTNGLEITEQSLSSSDLSQRSRFVIWASPGQDIWEAYSLGEDQQDLLVRAAGIIDRQAELLGWSRFLRLPEIQSVVFMYFDGKDWTEQWDSEESESLPKAIQITVEIATSQSSDEETQLKTAIYTRTILIPGARFSATVEDAE